MKYIKSKVLFESSGSFDTDFDDIIWNCNYILMELRDLGFLIWVDKRKVVETFTSGKVSYGGSYIIVYLSKSGVEESVLNRFGDIGENVKSRLVDYLESEGFTYSSHQQVALPNVIVWNFKCV